MTSPTQQEAENLLEEAHLLNPGPWAVHSRYVALAAQAIAACHPDMDPQVACVLGLLHDIGRRYGVSGMRHVVENTFNP
jgi:HD superfamily phosphodiesterase